MHHQPVLDFYYSIGSRYSYLASTQLAKLEAETGCRTRWHPVDGAEIRRLRGRDPFACEPLSGQYEWSYRRLDAERWAEYYGVPFEEPRSPHFDSALLVRAAVAAKRLGALVPYSRALFRAVYAERVWPLDERVCRDRAASIGLPPDEFMGLLADPAIGAELHRTAAEAHRRCAFGVPTFFVGDRMFWGNDRLPLVRHFLLKLASGASSDHKEEPMPSDPSIQVPGRFRRDRPGEPVR